MTPYKSRIILSLPGAVFSGLFIYFVLQSLLVPFRIAFPITGSISTLIFGLTNYYNSVDECERRTNNMRGIVHQNRCPFSNIIFVGSYVIFIIITSMPYQNQEIFMHWSQFTVFQLVRLTAAIALTVFAPGYALVNILDRKHELGPIPKFLTSYLFSMLVGGLVGYVIGSIGLAASNINILFGIINAFILICFVYTKISEKELLKSFYPSYDTIDNIQEVIRKNSAGFIVFASLFVLVFLSTYYLYNGTIIGDELFHHGQALTFLDGTWKYNAVHGWNIPYPFFQHAFLATYFALSNLPSVNSYVALNFTNIIPLFAFYYFFSNWLPDRKRVAILASTLFMLSSGFGWVYLLNLETAMSHSNTLHSVLEVFYTAGIKTFDIWTPSTFIDVAHPDITTGLIIMALPAGFVLLGLIKENMNRKLSYVIIIAATCTLGFLSHDEFGLFILIASIIPILFRLSNSNSLFIGMSIALSLASFIGILSPDDYYRTKNIFGITFIVIFLIFVILMWLIYSNKILYKVRHLKAVLKIFEQKKYRFTLGVIIVSVVSYLYILSFIIWDIQNPIFDSRVNTNELSFVPWYFYPMKLGLTGLLGLCLILSFIFKKFEKEVFVFGIIAIITFLAGSYYSEHRLIKYIMASMAGFASLLLYRILIAQRQNPKKLIISGLIIGSVIASCSLSTVMYTGYSALALGNEQSRSSILLGGLWFPSDSVLRLLEFFHKNLNPKTDSIAVPNEELLSFAGLLGERLHGFIGIPIGKIAESSLSLKESTLGGFYSRLDYTNTKYIVLSKQGINNNPPSKVLTFALENFKKVYEDENYIILSVPPISPPSSEVGGDIALVSPEDHSLDDFGVSFRSTIPSMKLAASTVKGNETVWSNNILSHKQNVTYVEASFRILDTYKKDSHGGVVWSDAGKVYYVFLRPYSSQLSVYTADKGEILSTKISPPLVRGTWYTLKIVYSSNAIHIFLDHILRAHIPQILANSNVSRVGIRSFNSVVEFEPLKIGTALISNAAAYDLRSKYYYNYYYSLSALALSKLKYDIFAEGDSSAFSKKSVILTSDPLGIDNYLKFVRSGGTVIVLNTDNNNFESGFKKLLCIKPGKDITFDSITAPDGRDLKVLGTARGIEVSCLGSTVKSFYINNSTEQVTPFAVQKEYGNGKIVFVNILGYYSALSSYPNQFFLTLGSIPNLLSLSPDRYTKTTVLDALATPRFFGDLEMSGKQQPVMVSSSSVLFPKNYLLNAENISTKKNTFNTSKIRDLNLYGYYTLLINSTKLSYTPRMAPPLPPYSYISLFIPSGSNMTVKLFSGSKVEFHSQTDNRHFEIADEDIKITKIRSGFGSDAIPILIKNPEITTDGNLSFQQLHSSNPSHPTKAWIVDMPAKIQGKTIFKLEHTTNDEENRTRYITYFRWISISSFDPNLKLPITGRLLKIPWGDIIPSSTNIKIVVTILLIDVITIYIRSERKVKKNRQQR